jgi:hypothetical protein
MQSGFNSPSQTDPVSPFAFSIFGFVSDFGFRDSDLFGAAGPGFARPGTPASELIAMVFAGTTSTSLSLKSFLTTLTRSKDNSRCTGRLGTGGIPVNEGFRQNRSAPGNSAARLVIDTQAPELRFIDRLAAFDNRARATLVTRLEDSRTRFQVG